MIGMANGMKAETVTIPDNTLSNTNNFDTYFETLVDGWNSEIILLFKKELSPYRNNALIGGWSPYAQTKGAFNQIYRYNNNAIQQITRNDWVVNVVAGDEYYIVRFGQGV